MKTKKKIVFQSLDNIKIK